MEVKIKNQNELIDATIEMVDGVMVVSPKEVKFEPKDGDVITCTNSVCSYTLILEKVKSDIVYSYAVLLDNGCLKTGDWSSYKNPRPATEEEKQKLFQAIADEGYEWDADKKQLVKLKWKPKVGEICFAPYFDFPKFITKQWLWEINGYSTEYYNKGWVFRTKEECEAFCGRLNEATSNIKL